MSSSSLDVVISVLTFRRPDDIRAILPDLMVQRATVGDNVEIVVVDNDPEGSARAAVEGIAGGAVRYVHEATPGISAARNRAIAESAGKDVLVFIDDDERPSARWLEHLLGTYRRYRSAAVIGRVDSEFEVEPEPWITEGRFFVRRHKRTGTVVPVAASHNLLLDLVFLTRHGLRFDERFGISGGSDTLLTQQITDAGGRIVWCDEAIAVEIVPANRSTRGWVLRRAYRQGNTLVRVALALAPTPGRRVAQRARMLVRGSARLIGGGVRSASGTLTRQLYPRAAGLRTAARGAGMLAGVFGFTYKEYRRD
ncbi:MAG: hypothetical protein RI885_1323 [Actinomycetota bacterium]|jgi:hypothetical protein